MNNHLQHHVRSASRSSFMPTGNLCRWWSECSHFWKRRLYGEFAVKIADSQTLQGEALLAQKSKKRKSSSDEISLLSMQSFIAVSNQRA